MEVGEPIVVSASEHPDGTNEPKSRANRPTDCERAYAQVARRWVAVHLERGGRGMVSRAFVLTMSEDPPLAPGAKVRGEFFYPGEQAGPHPS